MADIKDILLGIQNLPTDGVPFTVKFGIDNAESPKGVPLDVDFDAKTLLVTVLIIFLLFILSTTAGLWIYNKAFSPGQ